MALLSASAYLAFPIPITLVTVTAQTLVLNLIALLLDRRKAALTVAVWILLGAVGIPVYSGGRGGLSELVGPTGGFIFAFLVAAYPVSYTHLNCCFLFNLLWQWSRQIPDHRSGGHQPRHRRHKWHAPRRTAASDSLIRFRLAQRFSRQFGGIDHL